MELPMIIFLKTIPTGWYEVCITKSELMTEETQVILNLSMTIKDRRLNGFVYMFRLPLYDNSNHEIFEGTEIIKAIAEESGLRGWLVDSDQLLGRECKVLFRTKTIDGKKRNYIGGVVRKGTNTENISALR